jgi:hypothetical protein
VGGLNVLSGLGAQQQATSQAALNYPMSAQQNFANLLRGFTVPTSQSQTFTGPIPGAYSNSPLSQIAGLGLSAAGLFANKIDPKTGLEIKGTSVFDTIKNVTGFGNKPTTPTTPNYETGRPDNPAPLPDVPLLGVPSNPIDDPNYYSGDWGEGSSYDPTDYESGWFY